MLGCGGSGRLADVNTPTTTDSVPVAQPYVAELDERSLLNSQVIFGFKAGNFRKLEDLADKYRNNEARFGSGVWKLTFFYLAFNDIAGWDN